MNWADQTPPSLEDIDALARTVFAALPEAVRALCGPLGDGLAIHVEDVPDEDLLMALDTPDPFDLLGFYHPDEDEKGARADIVFIYRLPLIDFWIEGEASLGGLVRHVLVHQIGGHFGLGADEIAKLEKKLS